MPSLTPSTYELGLSAKLKPLDGYVRVSRLGGRGGERFISPDIQEERIRAFAVSRGFEIGLVFRELDRSGADAGRPQLHALLDRIAQGLSGGVVVARIDRFARSAIDALRALRKIDCLGGIFLSVEDGFDSSTDFGQAMMTILLALAELELARVHDNWEMAQRNAIRRGIHTSSRLPVGYQRRKGQRLIPDPVAAPLVVEAFRRRSEGATYTEIARFFSEHRLATSKGSVNWNARSVESVLKNRVYTGEARHGPYRNPHAHEPLLPLRLWLQAQFGADARVAHPSSRTLLAGLARCAGCCHVLAGSWMPLPGGRPGRQLNGYHCRRRFKAGSCHAPAWILAREIEPLVTDHFFAALQHRRKRQVNFDAIEQDLAAAEAALARLWTEPRLSAKRQEERIAEAARLVETKHAELLALIRRDAFNQLPPPLRLRKAWPAMPLAEQRKALGLAFDAVVVERGATDDLEHRVHFLKAGAIPEYFPFAGSASTIRPYIP